MHPFLQPKPENYFSGEKFDFIFGDLTDTPVDPEENASSKDLLNVLNNIVSLALSLLAPETGKVYNFVQLPYMHPFLAI